MTSSTQKLLSALQGEYEEHKTDMPYKQFLDWQGIVNKAKRNHYHDYKSELAAPCAQLVLDLTQAGFLNLADRAKEGEFDGTKEESEEWMNSPEGQKVFKEFFGKDADVTEM